MSCFSFINKDIIFIISTDGILYLKCDTKYTSLLSDDDVRKYSTKGGLEYCYGNISPEEYGILRSLKKSTTRPNINSITDLATGIRTSISPEEVFNKMNEKEKLIVLYTGSGISRSAGILTQTELKKLLYFDNIPMLCYKAIESPSFLINRFKICVSAYKEYKPTIAHRRLKELCERPRVILVTENIDNLHQKTGIIPKDAFRDNDLFSIKPDYVFLIGIGNPECRSLLYKWRDSGVEFFSVGLSEPCIDYLDIKVCICEIQSFFGGYYGQD